MMTLKRKKLRFQLGSKPEIVIDKPLLSSPRQSIHPKKGLETKSNQLRPIISRRQILNPTKKKPTKRRKNLHSLACKQNQQHKQ